MKDHITRNVLIGAVLLIAITIGIGYSYAFFTTKVNVKGNVEEMKVTAGAMELTFQESNNISLPKAKPGDTATKDFTVANTGTMNVDTTYNIKLVFPTAESITFKEEDLQYSLVEYSDSTYSTPKDNGLNKTGFINTGTVKDQEMYLATKITPPEIGIYHYYRLTITFANLDTPQDYNKGAIFNAKINVDNNKDAKLYSKGTPFTDIIVANATDIADDNTDEHNLRYYGPNATVKNYIYFNCEDYNFKEPTNDEDTYANQAKAKNCEKWRIIGLMNNVETESKGTQNLVKIIRDEQLPRTASDSTKTFSWDNKNASTGAETETASGKNDWTTAELMYLLNPDNETHTLNSKTANNSLYWNSGNGQCSTEQNNVTTTCDFTTTGLKNGITKDLIETVKWKLGGIAGPGGAKASDWYEAERSTTVPSGRKTEWIGKIGLMYPSDYGYATGGKGTGSGTYTRDQCLATAIYNSWDSGAYKMDCAWNDWLYDSSKDQWTLTPVVDGYVYVFYVSPSGYVALHSASYARAVRPSLYLTSNVMVINNETSNGSSTYPYILVVE